MAQETFRNMNQSMNGEHIYFSDFHFASHTQPEPCSEAEATLAPSEEEAAESTAEQQRRRLFFTTHSAQDFGEHDDSYDSMDEVDLTLEGLERDNRVRFLPPLPLVEGSFMQKKENDEERELEEDNRELEDVENCEVEDDELWTVSSVQTSAVETLEIQSIALPVTMPSEEVAEDNEEEEGEEEEEVATVIRATSNSLSYKSSEVKKDQLKTSTINEVAAPVVAQQLMASKVVMVLDNEASRKRKRASDSVETREPEPSSQRAKIVGAALAGMVVGSVGTIFALASM